MLDYASDCLAALCHYAPDEFAAGCGEVEAA
jgi:hypothetical protein